MTPTAAAFFDVDGTVARTDIVRSYLGLRTWRMSPARRWLWLAAYLPRVAYLLVLDRIDRARMNRAFYRGYRGLDAEALASLAREIYPEATAPRVHPAARERITRHRARGERVVLLTGSLDFIVAPLAADLGVATSDVLAVHMTAVDGILTGELAQPPLADAEKARCARAFAAAHGIDLAASWAYGDSLSDLAVLAAVGHPVAVNPDHGLAREAAVRGWPVERWGIIAEAGREPSGGSRP